MYRVNQLVVSSLMFDSIPDRRNIEIHKIIAFSEKRAGYVNSFDDLAFIPLLNFNT